jgi:hypothetical protein
MSIKYQNLSKNLIGFGFYFMHFALRTHLSEIWGSRSGIKITSFWVALEADTASSCGVWYCAVFLSSLKNPGFRFVIFLSAQRHQQAGSLCMSVHEIFIV